MRKACLLLPLLLFATSAVLADGGPEQAATAAASVSAPRQLGQRLRRHDAEVARLQEQVIEQESHSRRAADRLDEQDRQIATLQRQLEALSGRPQGGTSGR
jgi:post-segregation antitoxin (ccd killing protein)